MIGFVAMLSRKRIVPKANSARAAQPFPRTSMSDMEIYLQ